MGASSGETIMSWTRIPPSFLVRGAALSVLVWTVLRGVLVLGGQPGAPHVAISALLVTIVALVVWLDMRRMRELVFLADLGVTRLAVCVATFVPGAVLELGARIAAPALGGG
jgi:hypothetical protein